MFDRSTMAQVGDSFTGLGMFLGDSGKRYTITRVQEYSEWYYVFDDKNAACFSWQAINQLKMHKEAVYQNAGEVNAEHA